MEHWEFYLGIAVQSILFLGGGYAMVLRNDWSTENLKIQMEKMGEELEKLAEVITKMAVQETEIRNLREQLTMLQRTVEGLRRGDGFIRSSGRGGVNGEFP